MHATTRALTPPACAAALLASAACATQRFDPWKDEDRPPRPSVPTAPAAAQPDIVPEEAPAPPAPKPITLQVKRKAPWPKSGFAEFQAVTGCPDEADACGVILTRLALGAGAGGMDTLDTNERAALAKFRGARAAMAGKKAPTDKRTPSQLVQGAITAKEGEVRLVVKILSADRKPLGEAVLVGSDLASLADGIEARALELWEKSPVKPRP